MANEIEVVVVVTSEAVVDAVIDDGDFSSVAVAIGTSEAVVEDLVTVLVRTSLLITEVVDTVDVRLVVTSVAAVTSE